MRRRHSRGARPSPSDGTNVAGSIFQGREAEIEAFVKWVEHEPPEGDVGRVALLVGPPGMGKSALMRRFYALCATRREGWHAAYLTLNENETSAAFLERLLVSMYERVKARPVGRGPRDRELLGGLLERVPAAGGLLKALVEESREPAWARFLGFAGAVAAALAPDERVVLLVDPVVRMGGDAAADWVALARPLPGRLRILMAQRPDDVVAAHAERVRHFPLVPCRPLGDMAERSVLDWYGAELDHGRLRGLRSEAHGPHELRELLPRTAWDRLRGYPMFHATLVRLLAGGDHKDPVAFAKALPNDMGQLLDMLLEGIKRLGPEHLRAAVTLQVFGRPTPFAIWEKACGLPPGQLSVMFADPRFGAFFAHHDNVYAPYHPLFGECLERALGDNERLRTDVADAAWEAIEQGCRAALLARPESLAFELSCAVRVAGCRRRVDLAGQVCAAIAEFKLHRDWLEAAESDYRALLEYFPTDDRVVAFSCGNLSLVRRLRGDLREAESLASRSLEVTKQLVARHPGDAEWERALSTGHDQWGSVLLAEGDLNGALGAYEASLAIRDRLAEMAPHIAERQWDLAAAWNRVGEVARLKGDLDRALSSFAAAVAIGERLADAAPTVPRSQHELSVSYTRLGHILVAKGDSDGALRALLAGLAISERLAKFDPARTEWQRGLSLSHSHVGDVFRAKGDLGRAVGSYHEALKVASRLVQLNPASTTWQVDLAALHQRLAVCADQQGESVRGGQHRHQCRAALRAIEDTGSRLDPDAVGVLEWLGAQYRD